jgi:hypothetical protein
VARDNLKMFYRDIAPVILEFDGEFKSRDVAEQLDMYSSVEVGQVMTNAARASGEVYDVLSWERKLNTEWTVDDRDRLDELIAEYDENGGGSESDPLESAVAYLEQEGEVPLEDVQRAVNKSLTGYNKIVHKIERVNQVLEDLEEREDVVREHNTFYYRPENHI